MTLPYEQYNAIYNTRLLLLDLMDPTKTPKVPKNIREEARRLLKHFPNEYEANDLIKYHTEWLHEVNQKGDTKRNNGEPVQYSPRHGGWIFWDETEQHPSKGYLTRRDAVDAMLNYAKTLENTQ